MKENGKTILVTLSKDNESTLKKEKDDRGSLLRHHPVSFG